MGSNKHKKGGGSHKKTSKAKGKAEHGVHHGQGSQVGEAAAHKLAGRGRWEVFCALRAYGAMQPACTTSRAKRLVR
jgi:hypothetical protein